MDDKHKSPDLSLGECARCDDVLTNEKKQDKAHSHSGVRVDVHNVEVSGSGHVVIGVDIVQCHHAIITNSEFLLLSNYQLVVKLYDLIVTFPCSHFLHTFAPRKHVM